MKNYNLKIIVQFYIKNKKESKKKVLWKYYQYRRRLGNK